MRRSPLKYGVRVWIKKTYPLFWKTCQCCFDELKRETVWQVKVRWEGTVVPLPNPQKIYLCMRCYQFNTEIMDLIKVQSDKLMDDMLGDKWKVRPKIVIMK